MTAKAASSEVLLTTPLDPLCARAWTIEALIGYREWLWKLSVPNSCLEAAIVSARRAVALAPADFYGQLVLAQCYRYSGAHELADRHLARAIQLNPNRPGVISSEADAALFAGNAAEAIAKLEKARAVDPYFEPAWYWSSMLFMAYAARRYAEATAAMRRISSPAGWNWAVAAAAHAMQGEDSAAVDAARRAIDLTPDFTIYAFLSRNPFRKEGDRAHLEDGLRKAGLP